MSETVGLECPKCQKNELVRLENSNTFRCIACGYTCDLSQASQSGGLGWFYMALISIALIGLGLLVG